MWDYKALHAEKQGLTADGKAKAATIDDTAPIDYARLARLSALPLANVKAMEKDLRAFSALLRTVQPVRPSEEPKEEASKVYRPFTLSTSTSRRPFLSMVPNVVITPAMLSPDALAAEEATELDVLPRETVLSLGTRTKGPYHVASTS